MHDYVIKIKKACTYDHNIQASMKYEEYGTQWGFYMFWKIMGRYIFILFFSFILGF